MKDQLREILYGGAYKTDPGSDWYKEQDRRLDDALALLIGGRKDLEQGEETSEEGEEGMAKKKKKDKPDSFLDKMIKKDFVEEK